MIAAREGRRRSWRRVTGSDSEPQTPLAGIVRIRTEEMPTPSYQWNRASRWPEWFGAAQLALLNLAQIEDIARERLPPSLALWITYGVEDEESLVRSKRFHHCLLDCFHRC